MGDHVHLQLEFDPPAQRHSPESVAAAEDIVPSASTLRARVYAALVERGPMTDEEMQEVLGMNPSTQRPRRVELWRAGKVARVGKRLTRSGRTAAVWGVTS